MYYYLCTYKIVHCIFKSKRILKTLKKPLVSLASKVHIFWEGHKILRNLHITNLSYVVPVKSKVEISQNFVAFSEYTYEL